MIEAIIISILALDIIRNQNVLVNGARKVWTEEDEARRIQQIMEAEELEYEMEQRSQSGSFVKESSSMVVQNYQDNYPLTQSYHYIKETPPAITFPTSISPKSDESYWCYYCTSPLYIMSGNMQRAIEKFLRIRRTVYPVQVKNIRCSEPRNLTDLAVEKCRHPYCQTLILMDHNTGSAFTMRGCAETFGAINEKLLDSRGDNTCQRLHEQLDIQECICRNRRYCYPGSKHRFLDSSATALFMASTSFHHHFVPIFCYILLIFLKTYMW